MPKRLTDTEIWDQDWFVELPAKYKLFWYYIKDRCDDCGVWRPNKVLAQRIIGEPLNVQEFLDFVNIGKQRVVVLPTGRWFLRDYFIFQYGEVFSPRSPVHKGAIRKLVSNGVHPADILGLGAGKLQEFDLHEIKRLAYCKDINSLTEAYEKGSNRNKDKDKDIDKVKDKVKE